MSVWQRNLRNLFNGTTKFDSNDDIPTAWNTFFFRSPVNPLDAIFFIGNIKTHLHFISFLNTDMIRVFEVLPHVRQELTYSPKSINIMGDDVLATQGARASAIIIFTMSNRNDWVPARWGIKKIELRYPALLPHVTHSTIPSWVSLHDTTVWILFLLTLCTNS